MDKAAFNLVSKSDNLYTCETLDPSAETTTLEIQMATLIEHG